MKENWVISVGNNWGHFFFYGTENESEKMRCHKANWEHAMTKKRLATEDEIKTQVIDGCWNHPNFKNINRYYCECPKCKK